MLTPNLFKKMRLMPGMEARVVNPPPGMLEALQAAAEGISLRTSGEGKPQAVLLFAASQAELAEYAPVALAALEHDGLFWAAYPKKSSGKNVDLYRDGGWAPLEQAGLRPVTQIALDETWSALRFRPAERVGR